MEESSQNKNRMNYNDEIYLNDVVMEKGENGRRVWNSAKSTNRNFFWCKWKERKNEEIFSKKIIIMERMVKMHYVGHFIV